MRLNPLSHQLLKTLETTFHHVFPVHLVVLVSGGRDSMVLMHCLSELRHSPLFEQRDHFSVEILHFNHQKRGLASDLDAQLVLDTALQYGFEVSVEKWSVSGFPFLNTEQKNRAENFQNAARLWRKHISHQKSKEKHAVLNRNTYFVTAHHARDHAESVLMHILRGAGIDGALGFEIIDEKTKHFMPFCRTNYSEILRISEKYNVEFREDESNDSDDYDRNCIRRNVFPVFEQLRGDFEDSFMKFSDNLRNSIKTQDTNTPTQNNNCDNFNFPFILDTCLLRKQIISYNSILGHSLSKNSLANLIQHMRKYSEQRLESFTIPLPFSWQCTIYAHQLSFSLKPPKISGP